MINIHLSCIIRTKKVEKMMITYEDEEIQLSDGSTPKEIAEQKNLREPHQSLAAMVNCKAQDITHPLQSGDKVKLLDFTDKEGKEVFWHTSAHVLAQAVLRIWPDAVPTIGPPIENGFYYDFANLQISEDDFQKIEKEIKNIIKQNFKPERTVFGSKKEAIAAFQGNQFKVELIKGFPENSTLTAYKQGEFFDLCRGPHLPNLGKIKAFKLTKTSGAYWKGDAKNEMLTRIYGISFPDKEQLKQYLHIQAEAKKRDHRVVGTKLDLFSFKTEAPAMPFLHPKGMRIWNSLMEYWREVHDAHDYEEIKTPQILTQELWEKSGHWEHYHENMYTTSVDDREFAIKPMNCPGCMLYYKTHTHSYREFPLRIAEMGHVHRYEPSGAVNGMFRVRSFHQDDAHIFMTQEQIKEEIIEVLHLVEEIYSTFGLNYRFELSTRPEKSIGSDEDWDVTTDGLRAALDAYGKDYRVNEGDGAFYGPKIDLHILDALGRAWQCGTIQLDMSLPERFDLTYRDADGGEKRPIMIHRAIFGSMERFYGILTEHFAGRFPLWMSPLPIRLMTVADRHEEYALEVSKKIRKAGVQCDVDASSESISKKVRNAQLAQINYIFTVGDTEVANQTISLRTRDNVVHGEITLDAFLEKVKYEKDNRSIQSPFSAESEKCK
jgi:threonyl-tRNA synthetase